MKRLFSFLSVLAAIAALTAPLFAGGTSEKPAKSQAPTKKVTMAYASFGSRFAFIAIVDASVKRAAKEHGVNLLFLDNEFNPDKAVENANIIASRGDVDLVMEFNYYQQQNYVISEIFKKANIPVIAVDIPIPGAVYYGADNFTAGKLAGIALAKAARAKWGGEEPVDLALVEAQSLAGQQELMARTLGIEAGIKSELPSLPKDELVQFEGSNEVQQAAEAVSTNLQAHPAAKHVIVGMLGDSNAVAALNYAKSAGRDALASGIGGDDVGIHALKIGDPAGFVGTSLFFPEHYGDDLIPLALDILAGKQVPQLVYIKHDFLDASNVAKYYPDKK